MVNRPELGEVMSVMTQCHDPEWGKVLLDGIRITSTYALPQKCMRACIHRLLDNIGLRYYLW